jgi:predicted Zn-dependent protease
VYGEDPSEGFVRGRKFLHPKLGFMFTAPDGYTLDNTAQAVIGLREGGTQAMRFDVARVPAEQTLTDYLGTGWMEKVDKNSIAELSINGFPGATAVAHGEQWRFRIYVLRYGNDVYRFIFAGKPESAAGDTSFRETVFSFRRLTAAETLAAHPLRIHVLTAQPGDTIESLAQRMSGTDRQVERFRMLNGFGPHDTLKPRDRIKIVRE